MRWWCCCTATAPTATISSRLADALARRAAGYGVRRAQRAGAVAPACRRLQWFPLTLRDPTEYWRGVGPAPARARRLPRQGAARYGLAPAPGPRRLQPGHDDGAARRAAADGGAGRASSASPACSPGRSTWPAIKARPPVLLIHGADDDLIPVGACISPARRSPTPAFPSNGTSARASATASTRTGLPWPAISSPPVCGRPDLHVVTGVTGKSRRISAASHL